MTSREAQILELKKLKGKPLKDIAVHIATYYWIPITAFVVVIAIAVSVVTGIINRKETILQGYIVNASEDADAAETLSQDLARHLNMTEKQQINLLANLNTSPNSLSSTLQVLSIHSAAQEIDFVVSDATGCEELLFYGYYAKLDEVLTQSQLERLSSWLVYCERSELEPGDPLANTERPLPKIGSKDTMKDPVPVAICPPAGNRLTKAYRFSKDTAYIMLIPGSLRTEAVWQFLDFIMPQD